MPQKFKPYAEEFIKKTVKEARPIEQTYKENQQKYKKEHETKNEQKIKRENYVKVEERKKGMAVDFAGDERYVKRKRILTHTLSPNLHSYIVYVIHEYPYKSVSLPRKTRQYALQNRWQRPAHSE